jgi:hypothetical protein
MQFPAAPRIFVGRVELETGWEHKMIGRSGIEMCLAELLPLLVPVFAELGSSSILHISKNGMRSKYMQSTLKV